MEMPNMVVLTQSLRHQTYIVLILKENVKLQYKFIFFCIDIDLFFNFT